MAHQRADAVDAVDARQIFREFLVIGGRVCAQFQHIAENGDAPAGLHRPRLQAAERGHHAGRIAVETVVDHGDAMGRLLDAAAGHDANMVELFGQRRRIEARRMDRRQRGQRVLQAVRRTGRQAEFDWLAVHISGDVPAFALGRMLQLPHLGSLAEANDLAVPFRRLDIPGQHQHAVVWQALS